MAHPYKSQATSSKAGKMKNLDMKGSYKHVDSSKASMQHMSQSSDSGYKAGGKVGKRGKSKKMPPIAPIPDMAPPSPDMVGMQAGAGASPLPAPAPMMRKSGGRVYTAGADTGPGRVQKAKKYPKP